MITKNPNATQMLNKHKKKNDRGSVKPDWSVGHIQCIFIEVRPLQAIARKPQMPNEHNEE